MKFIVSDPGITHDPVDEAFELVAWPALGVIPGRGLVVRRVLA